MFVIVFHKCIVVFICFELSPVGVLLVGVFVQLRSLAFVGQNPIPHSLHPIHPHAIRHVEHTRPLHQEERQEGGRGGILAGGGRTEVTHRRTEGNRPLNLRRHQNRRISPEWYHTMLLLSSLFVLSVVLLCCVLPLVVPVRIRMIHSLISSRKRARHSCTQTASYSTHEEGNDEGERKKEIHPTHKHRYDLSLVCSLSLSLSPTHSNGSSNDQSGADRNVGLITLYQNGFIIGNGEFRDIKDPKNKAVLESLKKR